MTPDSLAQRPVRVVLLTDIHVQDFSGLRTRDFATKRVTGWLNHHLHRAGTHCPRVLDAAFAAAADATPDLVVVTGDLSVLGLPEELRKARSHLDRLTQRGIGTAAVPGNHDYYLPSAAGGAFEEILQPHQEGIRLDDEPYPFVRRVRHVSMLLLNSACPTPPFMAWGTLGADQLDRAARLARSELESGQTVLVAVHHHPDRAPDRRFDHTRNLRDADALLSLCRDLRLPLVVHGHNHHHQIRRDPHPAGPLLCGVGSSSSQRTDRPEKRGEIGEVTVHPDGRIGLRFSRWSASEGRFGDWETAPVPPAAGHTAPHPPDPREG